MCNEVSRLVSRKDGKRRRGRICGRGAEEEEEGRRIAGFSDHGGGRDIRGDLGGQDVVETSGRDEVVMHEEVSRLAAGAVEGS